MIRKGEVPRIIPAPQSADRTSRRMVRGSRLSRAASLAIVPLWLLFGPSSSVPMNGAWPETAAGMERSCCWVLMDIESFYCGPCLEPLLAFCRALPSRVQEDRVRGILVYDAAGGNEHSKLRSRIVLKKWQGFRKAHDIRFPAVADAGPFFRDFLKDGIVILLVHEARSVLVTYALPLKSGQLDEIVDCLVDRVERP